MIRYDFFQSVKHVAPVPQSKTYEDFVQMFLTFETAETKEDRWKSFSFTQYLPGLTRAKDNIEYMTGFVFDFDNKECNPVSIKSVTEKLEKKMITHLWYHTYSHSKENLRWRLVIPFGTFIRPENWDEMFQKGLNLIGNPPGIDSVSRKMAQIYFYPYQPKICNTVFQAEAFKGHLLNPIDLGTETIKKEIIEVGDKIPPFRFHSKPIPEIDKINEAITYISPDVEYPDWIKVGMALKSELGDAAMEIWDNWSKKGLKYVDKKEIIYHWNTFNGTGIQIGSLYAMAKERGFKMPGYSTETKTMLKTTYVEKDITLYTPVEEDPIKDSISKLQDYVSRDMFDIPCPVLKELYEWVNQSSQIIQPVYSLATAISIMGFLKRQVICSPTNIKTNLYVLSMGPSRSGKNNGIECINALLEKLRIDNYVVSSVGSHQGLIKQLNKNRGFLYINNDEISYLLGNIQNKQSSSHEKNIEHKLLSLYNCKFQTTDAIKGEELEKVHNPFLHIYSTTTEHITETLKPHSATSGLLARFLIFQVKEGMPYIDNLTPRDDIPRSLINSLAELQKETFRKAIFEEEAIQWFKQFREKVRTIQQLLSKEGTKVDSLFGNLAEQSVKLSLLTTPFREHVPFGELPNEVVEKWPFIRIQDIQWGVAVALHCLNNNLYIADSFFDNSNEKIMKRICKKLEDKTKDGNWISKSDLYKAINFEAGLHTFEGIIKHLYDAQLIDIEKNKRARGIKMRWITKKLRKEMEKEPQPELDEIY